MTQDRVLAPKQEKFLASYTNPKSSTFGNARQSALEAGYTQEYADNIMSLMPDWLSENIGDMELLQKAQKTLRKTLEYEPVDEEGKVDNQLLATQNRTATFLAETLGKHKFSKKTETDITSGGEKLQIVLPQEIVDRENDKSA